MAIASKLIANSCFNDLCDEPVNHLLSPRSLRNTYYIRKQQANVLLVPRFSSFVCLNQHQGIIFKRKVFDG